MNNKGDALEEPNAEDPKIEAALRLAMAEARYHRAVHKIETHDTEPNSAQQVANKLLADLRLVLDGMPRKISDRPADPLDADFTEFGLKQLKKAITARCTFNQDENINF